MEKFSIFSTNRKTKKKLHIIVTECNKVLILGVRTMRQDLHHTKQLITFIFNLGNVYPRTQKN